MTYIKLEDVTDTLRKVCIEQNRPDLMGMIGFVIGLFDKTPKYELPCVVRCKDCTHYEPDYYDPGKGDCNGECDNLVKVYDDWFCPGGKRR